MKLKTIARLLMILITNACSQQMLEKNELINSGLKIENGPNLGQTYEDSLGVKYNYRYITAIITNDTSMAIRLQVALSTQYDYPANYGDQQYKVFLLPQELTPDSVTLYNNITNGLDDFLHNCLDRPYLFYKSLKPQEKCVITFGTFYAQPNNAGIVPTALFAKESKQLYNNCDSLINTGISGNYRLRLALKLGAPPGNALEKCITIPCGNVVYLEEKLN